MKPEYLAGARVGPWGLLNHLGSGGNAEVWRAAREDGQVVALKVLRRRAGDGYPRFRAETEVMSALHDETGVLPLLAVTRAVAPSAEPSGVVAPVNE